MYRWSNGLAQVDCNIRTRQSISRNHRRLPYGHGKIRNTYAWVQQNIRYIAFEAGILGP